MTSNSVCRYRFHPQDIEAECDIERPTLNHVDESQKTFGVPGDMVNDTGVAKNRLAKPGMSCSIILMLKEQ